MNRKNWFGKETKLEKDKLEKENANLKRKIQEMEYEIKIWKEKMKNSNEREELFQENYRSRNRERVRLTSCLDDCCLLGESLHDGLGTHHTDAALCAASHQC